MSQPENETGRTVRERYEAFEQANPRPRGRSALSNIAMPVMSDAAEKGVGTLVALGTVALLLLLAAVAVTASRSWAAIDRSGAAVGYAIVTFFLLLGGLGGAAAVFNHLFRVLPNEAEHHH